MPKKDLAVYFVQILLLSSIGLCYTRSLFARFKQQQHDKCHKSKKFRKKTKGILNIKFYNMWCFFYLNIGTSLKEISQNIEFPVFQICVLINKTTANRMPT